MNAPDRTESTDPRMTGGAVLRSTGRNRAEWFDMLDAWGAVGRPYREIAEWLTGQHGVSAWWAQKLIVEYEQARGVRPPGVRRDKTFEVSASKTVAVPVERLFATCVNAEQRERWLPGRTMVGRTSEEPRLARFDWEDGVSRVTFTFSALGPEKSQLVVQHERLRDAATAAEMKTFWRDRVSALKNVLEA